MTPLYIPQHSKGRPERYPECWVTFAHIPKRRHALNFVRILLDLIMASDLCRPFRASILTELNPRAQKL
jgi:hypothetical protein